MMFAGEVIFFLLATIPYHEPLLSIIIIIIAYYYHCEPSLLIFRLVDHPPLTTIKHQWNPEDQSLLLITTIFKPRLLSRNATNY